MPSWGRGVVGQRSTESSPSAEVAGSRSDRRRGLRGRDGIDGALVITSCRWVHTFGMRFAIDVAFVDDDGVVVKIVRMRPRRLGSPGQGGQLGHRSDDRGVRAVGPFGRRRRRGARRRLNCCSCLDADRQPRRPFAESDRGAGRGGADLLRGHPAHRAAAPGRRRDGQATGRLQRAHRATLHRRGPGGARRRRRVALVTDAGTPGISDPGEMLVARRPRRWIRGVDRAGTGGLRRRPRQQRAADGAVRVRGVPAAKRGSSSRSPRRDRRRSSGPSCSTRRPHRVVRTIRDLTEVCGPDRPVAVARELTKLYETIVRGTLGTIDLGDTAGRVRDRARWGASRRCRGRRRRRSPQRSMPSWLAVPRPAMRRHELPRHSACPGGAPTTSRSGAAAAR